MSEAFAFRNVTKRFGALTANRHVSFAVGKGSVHGVVGENGAGKSTIMKILYGLYQPDEGAILVGGQPTLIPSPEVAIGLGIGMVHQHFMLVPTLSVWRNVILGREPTLARLDAKAICERIDALQRHFGFALDLQAPVEDLTVGHQQQVEILKLLYREANILILDEPTAVLTPQEVEVLFAKLRDLKAKGKTICLITHKLKEILGFTERVTVMRRGEVVETVETSRLTRESLAEKIVGRKVIPIVTKTREPGEKDAPPPEVARLTAVTVAPRSAGTSGLREVSLSLRRGEIVGVAGVEGNGQQELVEALSGVARFEGEIRISGKRLPNVPTGSSTYALKQRGCAVIPPDRHLEGVVLDFSVTDNFLLGHQREQSVTRGPWLSPRKIDPLVAGWIREFDVRPQNPALPISALSGGNQQKVVIGRELGGERLGRKVECLIASHPTRGVDIGAIQFIHGRLVALRDAGAAVLLVSSELDEILALADRILVLFEGRIAGELPRSRAEERVLGSLMTGGTA